MLALGKVDVDHSPYLLLSEAAKIVPNI